MDQERQWSTLGKLKVLIDEDGLSASQFVNLAAAHGIYISNATLSRALSEGNFNKHKTSEALRPLVMGLEELVARAHPIPVSFDNAENIKFLLTILAMGVDLTVGAITRNQ